MTVDKSLIASPKRIVVAMSGGVDSSVCAALLKEQGHEVIGITMQVWDYSSFAGSTGQAFGSCCSLDDVYDARRVAESLQIPFYVVNFEREFQRHVIDNFCDEYFAGRTPNPCVLCNQVLKFELLMRKTRELNADYLATGHYAQIIDVDGQPALYQGLDQHKDQSYFLFTLTPQQMRQTLFPLGSMTKAEVRSHAQRFHLQVAEKAESQDICFVPDGDYVRFLEAERGRGQKDGAIIHHNGQVLGHHQGIYRYTIGQRKGLGLSWPEPLYVIGIDAEQNQVIVGEKAFLARQEFELRSCLWNIEPPLAPMQVDCRIRYRHHAVAAQVFPHADGGATVQFACAQQGVTPGQAAVFYVADRVIGGGWIA
jgi:tRNA-specific 2-thiouridylase